MTQVLNSLLFQTLVDRLRGGEAVEALVDELISALEQDELLDLLDGDAEFWPGMATMMFDGYNLEPIVHGEIDRLGIPGLRFSDGPRGVVVGHSTAFPVSMARGATWDTDLEERVGEVIGLEMRAQGANFFGGVCINLPRHPAWGRVQETYSEDPIMLGEFGAALIRGVRRNAMTVAKHYALNSMENARFSVDVRIDDAALHEVFLPHFRRAVEAGVDGIMTSYNSVNGHWAGENEHLMEDILRAEWHFRGVTVSDFIWGLRDGPESLRAGLDVEEPFRQQRGRTLRPALDSGALSWDYVDRAARRILETQLRFAVRIAPETPPLSVVLSEAHLALAREVAARSIVVVKNDDAGGVPILPLDEASVRSIAVIGRLADVPNTGDQGSSDVRSPHVVTALDGIREAFPGAAIEHVAEDDADAAAAAAARADVAIVIAGYSALDEGEYVGSGIFSAPALLATFPPSDGSEDAKRLEALFGQSGDSETSMANGQGVGGDRSSVRLRPVDAEIIRAAAAANPRTIVAIVAGGAVILDEWDDAPAGILFSWYSGAEGGRGLADVLLGRVDATGRLPFSIPVSEEQLPAFDRDATEVTYDKWVGQRLLDRLGVQAAYPLGFGLSYTTFGRTDLDVVRIGEEDLAVTCTVTNTGSRPGRDVIEVYGVLGPDAADFPSRVLLGFGSIALAPGESAHVTVPASTRPLQRRVNGGWTPVATTVTVEAARYSGDPESISQVIDLTS